MKKTWNFKTKIADTFPDAIQHWNSRHLVKFPTLSEKQLGTSLKWWCLNYVMLYQVFIRTNELFGWLNDTSSDESIFEMMWFLMKKQDFPSIWTYLSETRDGCCIHSANTANTQLHYRVIALIATSST